MSSGVADQLGVKRFPLEKPISVQLAVQGSRTKVNYGCMVNFEYVYIKLKQCFDIVKYRWVRSYPWYTIPVSAQGCARIQRNSRGNGKLRYDTIEGRQCAYAIV
jgi:hypothetical protein